MGIDEAGRGPLCGPLVVACCVLPKNYKNNEINDSKKITDMVILPIQQYKNFKNDC